MIAIEKETETEVDKVLETEQQIRIIEEVVIIKTILMIIEMAVEIIPVMEDSLEGNTTKIDIVIEIMTKIKSKWNDQDKKILKIEI